MLEGHHYQNAYITRDIDKAIQAFRDRAGVRDVMTYEGTMTYTTPAGAEATQKLAFIWIDDMQYELIQPVSGAVGLYADELPADDSMKFHHVAMRVDDWDAFRARVDREGYKVVLEGGGDALKFLYIDARDFLGHYLEYVWATPERWAQMGGR